MQCPVSERDCPLAMAQQCAAAGCARQTSQGFYAKAGEYTDASKPQQQPDPTKVSGAEKAATSAMLYAHDVQKRAGPTADRLRARLKRLDEIEGSYTAYLHDRIKERDWHGGWDVCVNLSEISCERDGLLFALEVLGEAP